jgi:hypothetical protein
MKTSQQQGRGLNFHKFISLASDDSKAKPGFSSSIFFAAGGQPLRLTPPRGLSLGTPTKATRPEGTPDGERLAATVINCFVAKTVSNPPYHGAVHG